MHPSRDAEAAADVLDRNRPLLDRLVAALLEKETLERADLEAVLGAPETDGAGRESRAWRRRGR